MSREPLVIGEATVPKPYHRRRIGGAWKVLTAWVILMGAIYGTAKWIQSRDNARGSEVNDQVVLKDQSPVSNPDQLYLQDALPACQDLLVRYLNSEDVTEASSLVLAQPGIAQRMAQYDADQQSLEVNSEALVLKRSTLLDLPEGQTVLTEWGDGDGALFDAAFRQQDGQWRLDWDHFVRYGDLTWSRFLAGSGDADIAEFRLHARRRLASKEDPRNSIGVVLSAPVRKSMDRTGFHASMPGIPLTEESGRFLEAAFQRAAEQQPLFGASYGDVNPADMIRVRVRIERITEDGGTQYRIAEVLACHWYASVATGLE